MIEIEEAQRLLAETFATAARLEATVDVATLQAVGRVLARPILCQLDAPPFHQSAMDGVAFAHDSQRNDYRLVGAVAAGDAPDQITPAPGECVRIMTGAPLPSTCDTVQMVEHITVTDDRVHLDAAAPLGSHVRRAGENNRAGDPLYPAGTRVTAGVLSGLLSQGVRFVQVHRPIRVGVGATGDEIVDHRHPLKPGQIYNSNGPAVAALLDGPGVEIIHLGRLGDSLEQTRDCLMRNNDLDLLVLSGGVSMGAWDLVPEAAEAAGYRKVFHKIRMKPGKPLWFGVHQNGGMLFGLPGNPVSALVGCLLYIQPMLAAWCSGRYKAPMWLKAEAGAPMTNRGGLPLLLGVQLEYGDNRLKAVPLKTNGSGDITGFSTFDSLALLPPGCSINSGEEVQVLLPLPNTIS